MTLAEDVLIRYRTRGHARFQLPDEICNDSPARERLASALHRIEGVYRVDLYVRQCKLSVRFIEDICSFPELAAAVSRFAGRPPSGSGPSSCCSSAGEESAEHATATSALVGTETHGDRETAQHLIPRPADHPDRRFRLGTIKESTVVEFCNDVLVLFLIKLHWHMITQHWLRQPWRYRYEWMAAIYLIYLLVRSKRPKV